MSVDLRKDGDSYRVVTVLFGIARWGSDWFVVWRDSGSQTGRPVPTATEAREQAEAKQLTEDRLTAGLPPLSDAPDPVLDGLLRRLLAEYEEDRTRPPSFETMALIRTHIEEAQRG